MLPDYTTMFVLSCVLGTYLCVKTAAQKGIHVNKSLNALFFTYVFAMVGARSYFLIQHYDFFFLNPQEILAMWKGGFASYGGFLGGALGAIFYLKKARISIWRFADCLAPSIALGIFITRIGCFLNGCCFGKVSQIPWAVRFPAGSGPYELHQFNRLISTWEVLSLPVHPTQLYHALIGFILFLYILIVRNVKEADGRAFWRVTFLYSIIYFTIEFFRGDIAGEFVSVLTQGQIFSIIVAAAGFYFLYMQENHV